MAFALVRKSLGDYQDFKLYREDGTEAIYSPLLYLGFGHERAGVSR